MTKAQTNNVVDLRLVGPRTYTNPTLFSRPLKRGEVVKSVPIDRANVLLDLHSGDGDDKRYFFETASAARGVTKRAETNSQRSVIEFSEDGAEPEAEAEAEASPEPSEEAPKPTRAAKKAAKPAPASGTNRRTSRAKET